MPILINDNTARVQYTATAGQTVFIVPYEFFETGDLKVYNGDTLLTYNVSPSSASQYSVIGAGVTGGGSITLGTPGATLSDIITIVRDIPIKRVTDFPSAGPFNIQALNAELDKMTAVQQNLETDLDNRVLRLGDSDTPNTLSAIPNKAARQNKLLGFDLQGQPVAYDTASLATLVAYATAFADTFTGDGSDTTFTLSGDPAVIANLDVSINGVTQVPLVDYTLSGTTLTTTTAVPNGAVMLVKYKEGLPNYSGDAQDVRYNAGFTGAVQQSVKAKLEQQVSITDFSVTNSDWGATLQLAIDALGAQGGEILIPNQDTEYTWKTIPKFPASLTGKLSIIGTGTPVIKFTATGNRFLDVDRTADYQTFRNLLIDGLYIDTDGQCDQDHIIFGTRTGGSWASAQRTNFDNITIQNVECVNVGTDPAAPSGPFAVAVVSTHLASAEVTQTTIKNITVKNVVSDGGFALTVIAGVDLSGLFNANVYLDNIVVEDCRHMIPTKPTNFFGSSCYIIGGGGFGNRAYFRNLYGQNSGDNIYEVDAMQNVVYDNCTGKDPYNLLFYTTNYHAAPDYRSQTITYNNCGGEITTPLGRAFSIGESNGNPLGKIVIDTPSIYLSSVTDGGYSNRVLFMPTTVSADVEVRSPTVDVNFAGIQTKNEFPELFRFTVAADRTAAISNMNVTVRGSLDNNGYNWSFRAVAVDGAGNFIATGTNQIISALGTTTAPGSLSPSFLFNLGELISGKLMTSISGIRGSSTAPSGNAVKIDGVKYRNNLAPDATHTHSLYDCDFTGFNVSGSNGVVIDTAANGAFIRRERIKYLTTPGVVTETVGASPATLTNLYGTLRSYVISGGTVSDVSISNNGGSTFTSIATTTGVTVSLDVGQVLRITYSGLPTVKSTPASTV